MAIQDLTPQLRTRLRRVERIVGFFVAFAVVVLAVGFAYYLYNTAQRRGWFIPKCPVFTFLESAEGLKVGDPVTLMGFDVGNITAITAEAPGKYYKVFIALEVRRPYYGYIWTDSRVRVQAAGLLSGRGLEITAGEKGTPRVREELGRVSELLIHDHWEAITKAHKGLFLEADEQPPLSDRAQQLVSTVEKALPNILGLTNQVAAVLNNSAQLTSNANQVVTNLIVITDNIRDPHGSLGEWLIPSDLHTNLNTNLVAIASSLNDTILNLASITSNLNRQVQSNDTILVRISTLVVDTDNLVQGLKKHWLLRGIFQKMNSQTNAPTTNLSAPKSPSQ